MIDRSTLAGAARVPIWPLVGHLSAAVLIVLVTFCLPPWVLLDPVDRFTFLDPTPRSMIREVFAAGESRLSAEAKLAASGYHPWPDPTDSPGQRYRKIAVTWTVACSNDFIVQLTFNDDDRLVGARNDIHSVCL
jgi:hypothetical protein